MSGNGRIASGLDRRGFLKAGAAGAGILIIPFRIEMARAATGAAYQPNAFLRVEGDGRLILSLPKTEMGQSVYTAIAMLAAEELEVVPSAITVELPDGEAGKFGEITQDTGGSTSMRETWLPVRQAAADTRAALLQAAAQRWKAPVAECSASNGRAVHAKSGREIGYGELTSIAATLPLPRNTPLKPSSSFAVIGKPVPRLDSRAKVTGNAVYGIDVVRPGMKVGTLAQSPVFGGRLKAVDEVAARKVKGVVSVVKLDDAVAVVADHYWAARKGLEALAPSWDDGGGNGLAMAAIADQYGAAAAKGEGFATEGSASQDALAQAMEKSSTRASAEYEQPFLAHAAMEPGSCVLHLNAGELEIWTGTQIPSAAREAAAKAANLPIEKVKLHNHLMGGGFGRRLEPDFIIRAVQVAKQLPFPLKLIWSREEDFQHDLYRPFYRDRIEAGLDKDGFPVALSHRIAGSSIMARLYGEEFKGVDQDAVEGSANTPYRLPVHRVEYIRHETAVPTSWWRGVGGARSAFVVESFVDELAHAAKIDPIAYRRKLATSDRVRAVLDLVEEKSGWRTPAPDGHARGVALIDLWGTSMAQVVEVKKADDGVKVVKVTVAVDCGQPINPLGIKAQIEGGVIFGLSAALHGEITIANGRVEQSNFHDYPVLRMSDAPDIEVHIVDSHGDVGGLGEPPVAAVMPAIANATFALTGKRIRKLPIAKALSA